MRINGTTDTDLKPCPFCGGEAFIEEGHRAFIRGKSTRVNYIRCRRCNARTNRYEIRKFGKTSHSTEALKLAKEAWNRRVSDD